MSVRRTHITMLAVLGALVAALVGGTLGASAASAATLYVDKAIGSNDNDCLSASLGPNPAVGPCSTIQAAIDKASPGDTISIGAGEYTENITVDQRVTIQGAGSGSDQAQNTVVSAANPATPVFLGDSIFPTYSAQSHRLVFKDMRIRGANSPTGCSNNSSGINFMWTFDGYLTLNNVVLTENCTGLNFNATGLLKSIEITDSSLSGNVVVGQASRGLRFAGGADVDGLTVSGSNFDGNTFGIDRADPTGAGTGLAKNVTITTSTFNDNTFYGLYMGPNVHDFALTDSVITFAGLTGATSAQSADRLYLSGSKRQARGLVAGLANRTGNVVLSGLRVSGIPNLTTTSLDSLNRTVDFIGIKLDRLDAVEGHAVQLSGSDVTDFPISVQATGVPSNATQDVDLSSLTISNSTLGTGAPGTIGLNFPLGSGSYATNGTPNLNTNSIPGPLSWAHPRTLNAAGTWWGEQTGPLAGQVVPGADPSAVTTSPWIASYTPDPNKTGQPGFWPIETFTGFTTVPTTIAPDAFAAQTPIAGPELGSPSIAIGGVAGTAPVTVTVAPVEPSTDLTTSTPFTFNGATLLDISIDADLEGPFTICVQAGPTDRLWHYELVGAGYAWVDITERELGAGPLPVVSGAICGRTDSLSPFAVAAEKTPITVEASDETVTYGDAAPTVTCKLASGDSFVSPDDFIDDAGSTDYAQGDPAGGAYTTTCDGEVTIDNQENYEITYTDGTVTVNQKPITVDASDETVTYGDAAPTVTCTITVGSLASGDDFTDDAGSTDYAQGDPAGGTYTTTCDGEVTIENAANADVTSSYDISYTDGTVTVNQKPITVDASDETVTYGDAAPTVTCTITVGSLASGDDFTDDAGSTDYAQGDPAGGAYTTTCDGEVTIDNQENYEITYTDGTVTVNQKPITVDASDETVTYGDAAPTVTCTITVGSLASGDDFTDDAGSTDYAQGDPAGGTYTTTCDGEVTIENAANADVTSSYDISYTDGTVTVDPRPIIVNASSPANVTYGDPAPEVTCDLDAASSFVSPDDFIAPPTGSTEYTQGDTVGTYDTTCSGGTASTNYAISYTDGTLTVDPFELEPTDPWYTGQTFYYTKSMSETAVQVTLTASVTAELGDTCTVGDPGVEDAKVTFLDQESRKVLAKDVPVSRVGGDCEQGIATAFATLSTGNAFVESYVIVVQVSGSMTGSTEGPGGQIDTNLAEASVTVSTPPPSASGLFGQGDLVFKANSLTSTTELGTEGSLATEIADANPATFVFGFTYGKRTTPKGRAEITLPGPSGSVYYIKTNSITSVTSSTTTRTATVYAKASITQVTAGVATGVDGNASVRIDMTDAGELAGFTVQSSKTSALQYSNDWWKNGRAWQTRQMAVSGPGANVSVN